MKVISLKIKNVHYVQFSIIKCSFYAKNEIYRRGYTSYSDNFIQFVCMFYTIPAIYEIVQAVMLLGSTYLTRIVWHVFIVFIERSYAGTVYNTQGERPKVPHVLYASNRRINVNGFLASYDNIIILYMAFPPVSDIVRFSPTYTDLAVYMHA